jgi:KDO2-lipid IV(A) lauroyltransferase
MKRDLRYATEAVFLKLLFAVLGLLPLDTASNFGGWLARTLGPRLGLNRRAERSIRRALPDLDDAAVHDIIVGMWDNLGRVAAEYPHLKKFGDPAFARQRLAIVGAEHAEALRDDGKAGIFISGHIGNWELSAAGAKALGIDLLQVYRAMNNPLANDVVVGVRSHVAAGQIPKGSDGARQILKAIREGKHLGMLVDQKMNDGIAVPFFGRDAMTAPAVAELALRYNIPVLPAHIVRTQGARFELLIEPPFAFARTGDKERDVRDAMVMINQRIEDWIRRDPTQWLWLHKRWPD